MTNNDQMSPDASPGEVSEKFGVRRVNNRPMYILFGVFAAFLLVMLLVATDRSAQQNTAKSEDQKALVGDASMFANEIVGTQVDGFIPAAEPLTIPAVDESVVLEVSPEENPVAAPRMATRLLNTHLPSTLLHDTRLKREQAQEDELEAQRIRATKLKMLEDAIRARTGVQAIAPRSSNGRSSRYVSNRPKSRQDMLAEISRVRQKIAANASTDPTAVYQEKLAQVKRINHANGSGSSHSAPALLQTVSKGGANGLPLDNNSGGRWQLDSQIQSPRSPYELRAGFVVPATLISGINSALPGQIFAQVSQNVFDTATGRYLLIPQGARLIGSYSNDVAYGQERVLIAWQRIIFPDGKALDMGSMPGADAAGYAGFHDQVNNHYLRIFGSAFLMSGVTAGITLSQDNDNNGDNNNSNNQQAGDVLSEALGQQLGQVMIEMIRKNINIAPTLEIRPGYRFNVIVIKDMVFQNSYNAFDY